ncbi:GAF and ANTAR domain-containing protein [Actinoplanes sp. TFC3]|uniref:GAF and ANTAR domain-containing protein n=1 Tax=Actinoplanes sp. TFC3 TaxID=1710355 RepID=UPI00082FFD0E|nr:GAF and ANTAR domain-containing protein [Actinoplanes sp. TFC3]
MTGFDGTQNLGTAILDLANKPEPAAGLDHCLTSIAGASVSQVSAADYASVTRLEGAEFTIVAASDDIAAAVDEAQITDSVGPCLQALSEGEPVVVPDTAATMQWPGFQKVAAELGLHASVSVPLFTGWGPPVAVLNLYGRDSTAMAPLIIGVAHLYATSRELSFGIAVPPALDPGAEQLLTAYRQVLALRATINRAVTILTRTSAETAERSFFLLQKRAMYSGTTLRTAATAVLRDQQRP